MQNETTVSWQEDFDNRYELFRGNKDMFRFFIKDRIEIAKQEEKERIQKLLMENGHGGGNFRRIIMQL